MKQFTLSLLMTIASLVSFTSIAQAQDIPDDDDEIIIVITEEITENGPTRSVIPIQATFNIALSCLDVVFFDTIGEVEIVITDVISGSSTAHYIQSSLGEAIIPINKPSGVYLIEFNLSYVSYFGYLIL